MCNECEHQHHQRRQANCGIDGMADSIGVAAAEVLSHHRRNCKAECHHRQKERLHYARADSETGLGCRSKAANDSVNEQDINKEQHKLSAGRHTNPQHLSPGFYLWPEKRNTGTLVMIFLFEINYHHHVSDQNGNESCQRCAGHSQSRPRTNSENQQRRENDVEQYAEHLESNGRLNDSGGAQRGAQRHQGKLE